jgi:hypothetical protein
MIIRVTRRFEQDHPILSKIAQIVSKLRMAKISTTKLNLKAPKSLNQTNFETFKPCVETAYLGENVINLLQQKVAQSVTIS